MQPHPERLLTQAYDFWLPAAQIVLIGDRQAFQNQIEFGFKFEPFISLCCHIDTNDSILIIR